MSHTKADVAGFKGGEMSWTFLALPDFLLPILLYVVSGKLLNLSELQFSSIK